MAFHRIALLCFTCLITVKFEKILASSLTDLNNFHRLEAVDRVSETPPQVGVNLNSRT